ncbi:Uncharacterised protein [Mycobacteroides abscessus subsp. abscessus]|nr:Uncharacterised protein [Mycobacteroides abscessus subsp. abscessus]
MRCFSVISGPTWVAGSSGNPTPISETMPTMPSTTSSYRDRGASTRVWLTQPWPAFISPENTSIGSAAARSASSSTMAADLPPSSSVTFLRFFAAISAISLPTAVLPVKLNTSTSGLLVSARPVSAPPGTTDSTPSGTPASANTSARMKLDSGVSAAGLSTTVQPARNAGPILLSARNSGTFQAAMAATTPAGSRVTSVWP